MEVFQKNNNNIILSSMRRAIRASAGSKRLTSKALRHRPLQIGFMMWADWAWNWTLT